MQIRWVIHQWLAVVGERKGNQSVSRQPAVNTASDDGVLERGVWGRGRKRNGLVSIRAAKRSHPSCGMKNGCAWMPFQELTPSRILQRLDLINHPGGALRNAHIYVAATPRFRHEVGGSGGVPGPRAKLPHRLNCRCAG